MKQCSTCGEWKEEGEFREKKNQCKKCWAEYIRKYHEAHKKQVREHKKKYYKAHREQDRESAKKYHEAHRDITSAKRYFLKNGIHVKDVPPELLKAKALHILVQRKIKELEG